jgi:hypothetical protein
MPSRIIGRQRKPRALIVGFDDTTAQRIGRAFSASQVIEHVDEVEQQEWDVLVSTRSVARAQPHLYVVGVGCDAYELPGHAPFPAAFGPFHDTSGAEDTSTEWVRWTGPSRARELHVAENLPPGIERLIVNQLAPLAQPEKLHQWLEPQRVLDPFLSTVLNQCLAGRFTRPGGKAECWCFPQYAASGTLSGRCAGSSRSA